MTVEELQLEAFRQIRQKVSDITDESSNDEIAGYVKGIVNLEREWRRHERTEKTTGRKTEGDCKTKEKKKADHIPDRSNFGAFTSGRNLYLADVKKNRSSRGRLAG